MADNKQNTNPNVPNLSFKREQSEICSDSAERVINQKQNVPNLRFPEFNGAWVQSTIGDCFELYSGNTPSRMDKEHFMGDINWISSGELKEHYIGDTKEHISEKAAIENNLRLLPIGTFVIAIYGLEATGVRGTCSITTKKSTISQACMAFIPKTNVSNEFLYSWYKKHGNQIGIRYAQGTKQQNLSYDIIEKFLITYPCVKEQDKLKTFIALLDERIATQSKIIEDLKKLKVAICNRLLNNKTLLNKTAPLSNFGELKNGYAFKSSTYVPNGNYNIITIANVSGDREIVTDSCNTILSVPTDIQSHQILKSGDILISLTGNVGRVSLNKGNNNLLNQRVGLFVPNNSISDEFIYQSLSFVQFENNMINLAQGAAQMNIGKGDIESYQIRYSDNQQLINSISRILLDYDKKIEIENTYLQSLLSQKAYLLSNMFI